MDSFSEDINMASRGWSLWDGIVSRNPDAIETFYFVFIDKDRITSDAVKYFKVFMKEKRIRKAVILTDIEKIQDLIRTDERISAEIFPSHDIDCILKYYSLHKFNENFYVLSLDKFEQCCLKSAAAELSLEDVILRGLFRLKKM